MRTLFMAGGYLFCLNIMVIEVPLITRTIGGISMYKKIEPPLHMIANFPRYYKVDMGANCTTISKDWLLELGYDEDWIKTGKRLKGEYVWTNKLG